MCRDVLASRELLGVAHFVMWHAYHFLPQKKKVNRTFIPTHYTKWLRAIVHLEDQRLKQASCNSERFQVSRTEYYSEGKCSLRVGKVYVWRKWLGRNGDHHNDDNNKKCQRNRSIVLGISTI